MGTLGSRAAPKRATITSTRLMKFLNRKLFLQTLKPRYNVSKGQYFWDAFEGMRSFTLPSGHLNENLETATRGLADVFRLKKPGFVFGDRIAGWSDFGVRKQHSPISVVGLRKRLL
jgi:hypothetical protein